MVDLGYELIRGTAPETELESAACQACGSAIEALHTGSLIIDDIQDLSQWRRGGPTLHLKYGIPVALNAGNWLYFYAFQKIREGVQNPVLRLQIFELMEQVLREAHLGQALDLGTEITEMSPAEMVQLSQASLEMKSGALMALSLLMGAVVAEANEQQILNLKSFGIQFGVSLQMFDDLGNLKVDQPTKKHLEDLTNRRPSFVWWTLAQEFQSQVPAFVSATKALPDVQALREFLAKVPLLEKGREVALQYQQSLMEQTEIYFPNRLSTVQKFKNIAEKVANAY